MPSWLVTFFIAPIMDENCRRAGGRNER